MPYSRPLLLAACAAGFLASASSQDVPAGPNQHCRDDAGPAWGDLDKPYFLKTPATPVLDNGACPSPLAEACADKGIKYAHLASVPQCGGKGWFCRIMDQPGWENKDYVDRNFEHCNVTEADEKDQGGHCHGSDTDNVYGWWVRDHWMRGYPGTLHCCCDWGAVKGVVNRCDYRKPITSAAAQRKCRDANEEHNKGYEGTCGDYKKSHPFNDPVDSNPDQCWTVVNFADPESITSNSKAPNYDDKNDFPTTGPSPPGGGGGGGGGGAQPPSPPSPTPAPPAPEPETSSVCGVGQKAALMTGGTCPAGSYAPILDKNDCNEAAGELELKDDTATGISNKKRPKGCFYKSGKLWFNKATGRNVGAGSRKSVCCSVPQEEEEEEEEDYDEDEDEDEDEEEETSVCGEGRMAEMQDNGKCPSNSHILIASTDLCNEAAEELGLRDDVATVINNSKRPKGCYYRKNRLWFNKRGKALTSTARNSICCKKLQ